MRRRFVIVALTVMPTAGLGACIGAVLAGAPVFPAAIIGVIVFALLEGVFWLAWRTKRRTPPAAA